MNFSSCLGREPYIRDEETVVGGAAYGYPGKGRQSPYIVYDKYTGGECRKYTPQGGMVKVYARQEEDYVEISVEDNGCGLSPEDVARIVGEKVYDSKAIGMSDAPDKEELRKNKGSGFGLMNCKGIIEKYRKTNDLFKVCLFNVESGLGKAAVFISVCLPVSVSPCRCCSSCCLCACHPAGMLWNSLLPEGVTGFFGTACTE